MKKTEYSTYYRFFNNIEVVNGCWIWKGYCSIDGYAAFSINRKKVRAARFSYEMHFEEIPKGMLACHSCDNIKCVNPYHIFIGTFLDNMRDAKAKGRMASGDRHKGYSFENGVSNRNAKFTNEDIKYIREIYKTTPKGQEQIAKMFNTTQVNIGRIVNHKTWKHVV